MLYKIKQFTIYEYLGLMVNHFLTRDKWDSKINHGTGKVTFNINPLTHLHHGKKDNYKF